MLKSLRTPGAWLGDLRRWSSNLTSRVRYWPPSRVEGVYQEMHVFGDAIAEDEELESSVAADEKSIIRLGAGIEVTEFVGSPSGGSPRTQRGREGKYELKHPMTMDDGERRVGESAVDDGADELDLRIEPSMGREVPGRWVLTFAVDSFPFWATVDCGEMVLEAFSADLTVIQWAGLFGSMVDTDLVNELTGESGDWQEQLREGISVDPDPLSYGEICVSDFEDYCVWRSSDEGEPWSTAIPRHRDVRARDIGPVGEPGRVWRGNVAYRWRVATYPKSEVQDGKQLDLPVHQKRYKRPYTQGQRQHFSFEWGFRYTCAQERWLWFYRTYLEHHWQFLRWYGPRTDALFFEEDSRLPSHAVVEVNRAAGLCWMRYKLSRRRGFGITRDMRRSDTPGEAAWRMSAMHIDRLELDPICCPCGPVNVAFGIIVDSDLLISQPLFFHIMGNLVNVTLPDADLFGRIQSVAHAAISIDLSETVLADVKMNTSLMALDYSRWLSRTRAVDFPLPRLPQGSSSTDIDLARSHYLTSARLGPVL